MSNDDDSFLSGDEYESLESAANHIPLDSSAVTVKSLSVSLEEGDAQNDEDAPCDIYETPPEGSGSVSGYGSIAERFDGTDENCMNEVTVDSKRDTDLMLFTEEELTLRIDTEIDGTEIQSQSEIVRVSEREVASEIDVTENQSQSERVGVSEREMDSPIDGTETQSQSESVGVSEREMDSPIDGTETQSQSESVSEMEMDGVSEREMDSPIDGTEIQSQSESVGVSEREMDSLIDGTEIQSQSESIGVSEREMDGTEIQSQSERVRVSEREMDSPIDGTEIQSQSESVTVSEREMDSSIEGTEIQSQSESVTVSEREMDSSIEGTEIQSQSESVTVSEREMDSPIDGMSNRTELLGSDSPKACLRTETEIICRERSVSLVEHSNLTGDSPCPIPTSTQNSETEQSIDCEGSSVDKQKVNLTIEVLEKEKHVETASVNCVSPYTDQVSENGETYIFINDKESEDHAFANDETNENPVDKHILNSQATRNTASKKQPERKTPEKPMWHVVLKGLKILSERERRRGAL